MRGDLYFPSPKDSDYGDKILPPDFTFNELRGGEHGGHLPRLAAGIGGTAMPTWKNVLPEPDLWAMAHYVRWLVALRGTPERRRCNAAARSAAVGTPPATPSRRWRRWRD